MRPKYSQCVSVVVDVQFNVLVPEKTARSGLLHQSLPSSLTLTANRLSAPHLSHILDLLSVGFEEHQSK